MTSSQPAQPPSRGEVWRHALFLHAWLVLACLIMGAMNGAVSWAEPSSNPPSARSFQVGEQLTYDISWLNITAGTAVMAVRDAGMDGGRSRAKLITTCGFRHVASGAFVLQAEGREEERGY
jgi:hypothetical protein